MKKYEKKNNQFSTESPNHTAGLTFSSKKGERTGCLNAKLNKCLHFPTYGH